MNELNEPDDAANELPIVLSGAAPAGDGMAYAEPKSGGSYMRDPVTGALIQTAGLATNEQPEQE